MEGIRLDQFLNYQFLSGLKYSPNGKRAAFVKTQCDEKENGYRSNLCLYEDGAVRQITGMDRENAFFWEDDDNILFPADRTPEERRRREAGEQFTVFYRLSLKGGEALPAVELPLNTKELVSIGGGKYYFIAEIDRLDPDDYLRPREERLARLQAKRADGDCDVLEEYPFYYNGKGFQSNNRDALFLYDSTTGEVRRLSTPNMKVWEVAYIDGIFYFVGEDFVGLTPYRKGVYRLDPVTGETTCLLDPYGQYLHGLRGYHGGLLLLMSDGKIFEDEETPDFCFYDLETGKITTLLADNLYPHNNVCSDSRYGLGGGSPVQIHNDRIYYLETGRNASHLKTLDFSGHTETVYGGEGSIDCFDVNEKGEILGICLFGNQLQELYQIKESGVEQISHLNDHVFDGCYLAAPEKLTVEHEGIEIDGWVLKPIDYDPNKTYPALLEIHGGPRMTYGEVFNHEMQYFAGQGYFVFYCNPIGGDGRGDEFADIRGQYGGRDFDSLMTFTDAVLAHYPQIDSKRVAVAGGSYGGFMTNWVLGHTDRFAAACTQRSISNQLSDYGTCDIGIIYTEPQCDADFYKSPEKMWKHSPVAYGDHFVTPTLILHSDEDYRCPVSEGYQMFTAFQRQRVPCRMVIFHGENHELSRSGKPRNRIRRLKEIAIWFSTYTKSKKPTKTKGIKFC